MKRIKILLLALLMVVCCLSACDSGKIVINYVDGDNVVTNEYEPLSLAIDYNPTKEGFIFDGWYTDSQLTTLAEVEKLEGTEISLYAKWIEVKDLTLTLNTLDGKEPTTVTLKTGELATIEEPTHEYATFAGWYVDESCKTAFDATAPVMESATLYAKWKNKQEITITLISNCDIKKSTVKAYKGFPCELKTLERNCYTFTGWYTTYSCTDESKVEEAIFTNDETIFAGWKLLEGHSHEYTKQKTVAPTCTEDGYDLYACACGSEEQRNTVPALGHLADFSSIGEDNFFDMVLCSRENCYVRQISERNYDDKFVVNFNDAKKKEIDDFYQSMLDNLASAERYDETKHKNVPNSQGEYDHSAPYYIANKEGFEKAFYDVFYDYLMYVTEQYQYTYVFYCVNEGDYAWEEKYDVISDYRTDCVKNFYALYRLIHETQYREFFFSYEEGWTDEDIEQALIMSDSYGGDEYAELNKRADEILVEFRNIKNQDTDKKVLDLYYEFVNINTQIADIAGYDNYMEYAYENVYDREYSPEDVHQMREYVLTYIKPLMTKLKSKYTASYTTDKDAQNALLNKSIMSNELTSRIVSDYFKQLNSTTAGKTAIDYWKEVNLLFKNGNYYTGKHQGAFSYYIPAQEATILFFGPNSYSGAFTFVHEFGHYYNNVYNPGISLSMDHDETQSQGDEMLFMAWLNTHLCDYIAKGDKSDEEYNALVKATYDKVLYDQMFNAFAIIILATAVDEFEEIVYTNNYNNDNSYLNAEGRIKSEKYDDIFKAILKKYGVSSMLNASYWRYVVIEAPAYYISYAMSALPSVGIFVKAMEDGFDVAKESYFKLYTFSDNSDYTHVDNVGDTVVDATYEQILNYCGLYGPFQEELYQHLNSYLTQMMK